MEKQVLKYKRLNKDGIEPTRATEFSAGLDLYSAEKAKITPGCTQVIHTGIAVSIPRGYFGAIYARSGLATKKGIRPANAVGVIDSDYTGEILVPLYNDSSIRQKIDKGERIAQLVIQPYLNIAMEEVGGLNDTERGTGGFGSTGQF